ncbi:MAG: diguanylate cyclase [Micromonosporaceae bacterium]|jgi:diguanylate cyclase (GGDEF)-like protein|nr:diguanylate cyclase [Micromonosporaceae bacterium]
MRNFRRWATAAAVGLIAGFLGWMVLKPGGADLSVDVSDIASTVAGFSAAAACLYAGRRSAGPMRLGWTLIGAGMVCTAAGDAFWAWYETVMGAAVPAVSLADVAYLAQIPLTVAGITAWLGTRRSASDRLRTALDGLIIAGSLLYLSWATVLGTVFHGGGKTPLEHAVLLAYPIGDVATASMVFIMLRQVDRALRASLALAGGGLLALAVADSVYAYAAQNDGYGSGDLVDVLWFAAFVLIGLAGIRAANDQQAGRASALDPWRLVTLPYVPLALALVASVVVQAVQGSVGLFLYVDSTLLVLLVVARQVATLRDNVTLTRRLELTVHDLRLREEQLRHLAFHDPLTGLANRALFHDRVQHAIGAQVRESTSIGVLFIDLDGFKAVNDSRGHAVGDALLTVIGRRLRACARPSDTVARLGGDEFAVLVERLDEPESANVLARRIVDLLNEPIDVGGERISVGASVGVAVRDLGGESASGILREADCAMYAAKLQGKGRYVTFEPHMRSAFRINEPALT